MLQEIIFKNLQTEGLLLDKRKVHFLVAYSGGIDSTVLLHLLVQLRKKENITVTAAYYDHGWRGSSPEELPILHQNCLAFRVPLVLIQPDRTLAKTETIAREARYRELTRLASDLKADAVLTAHQADDQIETVLFNLFRGTGLEGLCGIQKTLILSPEHGAPVPIIRPMLDIYREGIRRHAQTHNLRFFEDPTNTNRKFQRNAIRHDLLPLIQERFPQAKNALSRLSHLAHSDLSILEEKLEGVWEQVFQPLPSGVNSIGNGALDAVRFNQLAKPYQRRIIKRFLLENHIDVDFQTVESTLQFISGETRRKNLGASLKSIEGVSSERKNRFLSLYKNKVILIEADKESLSTKMEPVSVTLPGEFRADPLNVLLSAETLSEEERQKPGLLRSQPQGEIYVDLGKYTDKPLELRTRRPGDRIQPLGMPMPMRLKNYLINRGIPRFERDRIPLLASGKDILWVGGIGISETLRVADKPTHRLKLEFNPEPTGAAEPSCP